MGAEKFTKEYQDRAAKINQNNQKMVIDEAINLLQKEGYTVLNKEGWKILPVLLSRCGQSGDKVGFRRSQNGCND